MNEGRRTMNDDERQKLQTLMEMGMTATPSGEVASTALGLAEELDHYTDEDLSDLATIVEAYDDVNIDLRGELEWIGERARKVLGTGPVVLVGEPVVAGGGSG